MKDKNLKKRPPVVTILGHIDHGKTTLLDKIRKTEIAEDESGGITQHIGAYQIEHSGDKITFIDTPGHEAFSAMRRRRTKTGDISILVIDSAEGVKTQTIEAIKYIKEAKIPMIVALNKIDKNKATPEKIKGELVKEDVLVEKMGGEIPTVEISAKTGEGIDDLIEVILLVAEMEELKTNYKVKASGVVVESFLDDQRGPTVTLIPFDGVLKKGDVVGTNSTCGKIKRIESFRGKKLEKVLPSQPAFLPGSFSKVPKVGEKFEVYEDKKEALQCIRELERNKKKKKKIPTNKKVLNLVIKTDVVGSKEAIVDMVEALPQDDVAINILRAEVGEIKNSDIELAEASDAILLSFRTKSKSNLKKLADKRGVKIVSSDVIYELIEKVRKIINLMMEPEEIREDIGKFKVLALFLDKKKRQIVGGKVIDGEAKAGALLEIIRDKEKVGEGKIINLKRQEKDVDRVPQGEQCGMLYEGKADIEEGDTLKIFKTEKRKNKI